jgi:hypothetical protein
MARAYNADQLQNANDADADNVEICHLQTSNYSSCMLGEHPFLV